MWKWFCIALVSLGFSPQQQQKNLQVELDGLQSVTLKLRDALMGTVMETYQLDSDDFPALVNDLNHAEHKPKLKMTMTCYLMELQYADKVRRFATNGVGIGPTAMGSFMTSENLVTKYWNITKDQLCKPKDPANAGGGGF